MKGIKSLDMRLQTLTLLLSFSVSSLLLGCANDQGASGGNFAANADSWLNEKPANWNEKENQIAGSDVFQLGPSAISKAESMLLDEPIIEVTPHVAAELIGKEVAPVQGLRLYLVRGLAINPDTGGFYISTAGDALIVQHASLGRGAIHRLPVIVRLAEMPGAVYVQVSGAN